MRLVEFGVFPTEAEMVMWQANCDTITQQLELRLGKSAEDLIKDTVLVEILKTVVERMPRTSDIFRTAAILSNQSFINSKTTVLNGILKICQNLTKSIWKNGGIFDKTFFLEIVTLYCSTNEKEAGEVFEKFLNRQLISKSDVVKYIDQSGKGCLEELIEFGKSVKSAYEEDRNDGTAMNIVEYLVAVGSLIVDLDEISKFVQKHNIKVDRKWMNRVPDVFEFLYTTFDYPTLFEIASNIDGFPLRKVFESRSFALQRLVECYDTTIAQNSKMFTAYSVAMGKMEKIDAFCEEVRMKSVERMRKCGYFENLGISNDEEIQAQISYVSEMWPDSSPQYIHLILRHFSYNAELAVSNLCTNEGIPIELKFLKSNTDWSYNEENADWPPLDFTASDEIERALYADIKRKESEAAAAASKKPGLFSLAHNNSKSDVVNNSPEHEMSALRRKAEEYKANVFSKLNKIRAPPEAANNDDEEVLVPMTNSKIYSALNNLQLTAPEMVAIRPTYDKYKYETPNDDGMYDDEYDDEYEARVFNIERLNEELESSSDEEGSNEQAAVPSIPSGSRGGRGGRGGNKPPSGPTKGSRQTAAPVPPPGLTAKSSRGSSDYTGGRNRQLKERHKSDQKQRGADRKHRGVGY